MEESTSSTTRVGNTSINSTFMAGNSTIMAGYSTIMAGNITVMAGNNTVMAGNNTIIEGIERPQNDFIPTRVRVYFDIGLIALLLWTVLIITLNLAVIVILYRHKKRTRLYFFVFHLAMADLLTGIIHCIPHSIERIIGYDRIETVWLAGDFLCKAQWTFGHVTVMTSNYILAFMSVDRAFAVCRPMENINKGYLAQKVAVTGCWVFSLLVCSPYFNLIRTYPNFKSGRPSCMSNYPALYDYEVELILKLVFVFIIPLTIIIVSYVSLLFAVHHRSSPSLRVSRDDPNQLTANVFNASILKSKMKSIKLTIGIVLSFVLCWSAHFAGEFMGVFGGIRHPIFIIMTTFYYLNSIANPVLFFIYHHKKSPSSRTSYISNTSKSAWKGDNPVTECRLEGRRFTDATNDLL